MIIKTVKNMKSKDLELLEKRILEFECDIEFLPGEKYEIFAVLGDTSKLDDKLLGGIEGVVEIKRIQAPFKRASREFKKEDTIVDVKGVKFGGDDLVIIAGPCSVENDIQIDTTAAYVKKLGSHMLRGGIVKPRTSPYAFQGLGQEGVDLMVAASAKYDLPIISEIMSIEQLHVFAPYLDVVQIGARNMQNFDLLKECGKIDKPILLKRGMSATIEEWLMSAEYIMANGNQNVILCERGIRTFETAYRNITDLNAIPYLKRVTHLPIVVDPSHATGKDWMTKDIALAAIAAGAHGIMLETHYAPELALSDGPQSLDENQFNEAISSSLKLAEFMKTL